MQKQQTNTIKCDICKEQIPKRNIQIHKVRCSMKNQNAQLQASRLGSSRMKKRNNIFEQKKVQVQKESQQQKIPCPLCGYMQTFQQLDSHPDKCAGKQSICQYCGDGYPLQLMQQHESMCQQNDNRQQNYSEQFEVNPIDRLMNLIDILNRIGVIIGNMNGQEQSGLSKQELQKLNRIKYKPGAQEDLCTICYCKLQKGQQCILLKCKHIYHSQCIQKWLQKNSKCPVCKADQKVHKQ